MSPELISDIRADLNALRKFDRIEVCYDTQHGTTVSKQVYFASSCTRSDSTPGMYFYGSVRGAPPRLEGVELGFIGLDQIKNLTFLMRHSTPIHRLGR